MTQGFGDKTLMAALPLREPIRSAVSSQHLSLRRSKKASRRLPKNGELAHLRQRIVMRISIQRMSVVLVRSLIKGSAGSYIRLSVDPNMWLTLTFLKGSK